MKMAQDDRPVVRQTRAPVSFTISPATRIVSSGSHPSALLHLLFFLPFLAILIWLGVFFYNLRLSAAQEKAERPLFSQMRPVTVRDFLPVVRQSLVERYGEPVDLRLEPYHNQTLLFAYQKEKLIRRRPILSADLDETSILKRYADKTSDQADSVRLKTVRGKPYVYVYSSEDVDE